MKINNFVFVINTICNLSREGKRSRALKHSNNTSTHAKFSTFEKLSGGGLFNYSVKPGPELSRSRLGLVRLVIRSVKARFGQVASW